MLGPYSDATKTTKVLSKLTEYKLQPEISQDTSPDDDKWQRIYLSKFVKYNEAEQVKDLIRNKLKLPAMVVKIESKRSKDNELTAEN